MKTHLFTLYRLPLKDGDAPELLGQVIYHGCKTRSEAQELIDLAWEKWLSPPIVQECFIDYLSDRFDDFIPLPVDQDDDAYYLEPRECSFGPHCDFCK